MKIDTSRRSVCSGLIAAVSVLNEDKRRRDICSAARGLISSVRFPADILTLHGKSSIRHIEVEESDADCENLTILVEKLAACLPAPAEEAMVAADFNRPPHAEAAGFYRLDRR